MNNETSFKIFILIEFNNIERKRVNLRKTMANNDIAQIRMGSCFFLCVDANLHTGTTSPRWLDETD